MLDIQVVRSQDTLFFDKLKDIESLSGKEFTNNAISLFDSIYTVRDIDVRYKLLNKLFEITEKKDEIAHIRSLIWKAETGDSNYAALYEKAFRLAKKYDRIDDMCLVEYSRGQYYIGRKHYDSAMIHILNYRDLTPEDYKGEGYRNIINMLGDIYYHAGMYDQAEEIYTDLYENYVQESNWNFYRPYVMINNLGLIALKTGKINEAINWFSKSIHMAENNLKTDYKYNTLAYSKIKLAETYLIKNNLKKAEILIAKVDEFPQDSIFMDVKQELLFVKSKLLLKQNKAIESLQIANKLMPNDSSIIISYRFLPEIYKFKSEIYSKLNMHDSAYYYSHWYNEISDSINIQKNVVHSMIILADRNHRNTVDQLQKTKQRIVLLIVTVVILLLFLVIIFYFYLKLYKSKLELVKKTIEKASKNEAEITHNDVIISNKTNGLKNDEQKRLSNELKELMDRDKLFLDPKINISDLAILLNTNRTYLSQAINTQLKTTFPNFLNEMRINEAIKLIMSGYAVTRTQDALARQSGFSNRTVFISAFKKHTGVLPSFFIANYKNENVKTNN